MAEYGQRLTVRPAKPELSLLHVALSGRAKATPVLSIASGVKRPHLSLEAPLWTCLKCCASQRTTFFVLTNLQRSIANVSWSA
jgi:hypothetical protein